MAVQRRAEVIGVVGDSSEAAPSSLQVQLSDASPSRVPRLSGALANQGARRCRGFVRCVATMRKVQSTVAAPSRHHLAALSDANHYRFEYLYIVGN